jgi:hypothetical protein
MAMCCTSNAMEVLLPLERRNFRIWAVPEEIAAFGFHHRPSLRNPEIKQIVT